MLVCAVGAAFFGLGVLVAVDLTMAASWEGGEQEGGGAASLCASTTSASPETNLGSCTSVRELVARLEAHCN